MPLRFDVKNGWKMRSRATGSMPGPLSLTEILAILCAASISDSMTTTGGDRRAGARLDGVAQQVGERLPQQHLVALDRAELAAKRHVAAERAGIVRESPRPPARRRRAGPRATA